MKQKAPLPLPPVVTRDDVTVAAHRCPYCRDVVERDAELVVCRDCLTRHHAACWIEGNAACSSCASTDCLETAKSSANAGLLQALGLSVLLGALLGTMCGVTSHDGLLLLLPVVSCLGAGYLHPRRRDLWVGPATFLSSFFGTLGLWVLSGNFSAHGFHPLNALGIVAVLGLLASALGGWVRRRRGPAR